MENKNRPNNNTQPLATPATPRRPNDVGALQIDAFVKIFDPKTKEVFVEKRA